MYIDNDTPRNWREDYEMIALFRVHYSLYEIKKCPICQGVIDKQHEAAFAEDREWNLNRRTIVGFELR